MAIYSDKKTLLERQNEMKWRQERKKERKQLKNKVKKKVFSCLK